MVHVDLSTEKIFETAAFNASTGHGDLAKVSEIIGPKVGTYARHRWDSLTTEQKLDRLLIEPRVCATFMLLFQHANRPNHPHGVTFRELYHLVQSSHTHRYAVHGELTRDVNLLQGLNFIVGQKFELTIKASCSGLQKTCLQRRMIAHYRPSDESQNLLIKGSLEPVFNEGASYMPNNWREAMKDWKAQPLSINSKYNRADPVYAPFPAEQELLNQGKTPPATSNS